MIDNRGRWLWQSVCSFRKEEKMNETINVVKAVDQSSEGKASRRRELVQKRSSTKVNETERNAASVCTLCTRMRVWTLTERNPQEPQGIEEQELESARTVAPLESECHKQSATKCGQWGGLNDALSGRLSGVAARASRTATRGTYSRRAPRSSRTGAGGPLVPSGN